MYLLTKEQLREDLYVAFIEACKNKKKKDYVISFKRNLDKNINKLTDELWNRSYKQEPSMCFIINHPKKREVFAAHFRDRIVHHLYFNYTHKMFENTFIYDNYSCIKGR